VCSGNSVESTRARYDAGVVHGTTRQCYAARLLWCTCFFWKTVPISFPFASCSCSCSADLRRAAGAVHPWRWPPPVATRYLLSRLWVHCGAERRNLGGWRGGTVGGHPGQDVEGRPTPAVPSPSVSSGNTWICRAFAAGERRRARRRLRGACCRWTMDLWSAGAEAAERSTRGACTTDCVAGERRVVDDGLERRSDDNEAAMGAEGSGVCRPGRAAVAEA
jgi:hypothetical protein